MAAADAACSAQSVTKAEAPLAAEMEEPLGGREVVVIDPDDEEVSTLESKLRMGLVSGEPEPQEKNESVTATDANSQGTPTHPKPQSLPKPASAPLGDEQSLQANKLLNSCQLCGTCFETRKGLSSHARFHLRQFGVSDSESSGAPIGTLYELMKRKGIPSVLPSALASGKPPSYTPKEGPAVKQEASGKSPGEEFQDETTLAPKSPKVATASPSKGQSPTSPSPLKKIHPILPKPPSNKSPDQAKSEARPLNAPQASGELLSKKLFWSPQDDNTPLNLTVNSEHISCQLCGACFETRKGLSSHSRAHLRHFGAVDVDSKGSPIEALNEFIRKKGIQGALSTMLPSENTHNYAQNSLLKDGSSHFKSALGKKESAKSPLKSPSLKSSSAKSPSMKSSSLKSPSMKSTPIKSPSMSSQKKPKQVTMRVQMESGVSMTSRDPNGMSSEPYWATSPINLSIDSHTTKDTRCEFCGDYFENRKGLSSHARSHLRQFGVTEWTVNGSPIDTLKELMKRKIQVPGSMAASGHKMPSKPSGNLVKSASHQLQDGHYPYPANKSAKFSLNISPVGQVPSGSLVPKKVGGGYLSPPPLKKMKPAPLKKVKQEYVKVEFNPEESSGSLKSGQFSSQQMWQDGALPLHLINQPTKAIRCEFCGDYFENRKGLSSHARSHLRQFGVTEWTVNGSPIAALRKLVKRKGKSGPFRHEPQQEPPNYLYEDRAVSKPYVVKSPVKDLQQDLLSPSSGKVLSYLPNSQSQAVSSMGKKIPMGFVSTAPQKKLLAEGRSMSAELKPNYPPSETGSYKPKSGWSPQKVPTSPGISADTCCELCGHYFENRKALASHARAHLRQFGVTEWHINGSPIDTLREWIRQKPALPSASPPGPPGGCPPERPIPKTYKNHVKAAPKELPPEPCSPPVGKMVKLEPAQPKLVQQTFPASPGVHKTLEADTKLQSECLIPTDLSPGGLLDCPPSSSMPSEDEEPHLKKKRKHPVKLGTCEYCGVTLTTGVGLSNHMRGHLKSGLKRKLPGLSQFEELHEMADSALTDTSADRKSQKPALCGENVPPRSEEGKESKTFRPKLEETRPPRVRPIIFPVPKPEPLSLVKFIGNIYTLKCRFCDVEFHGPLSIQEDWVRHLQRHILDTSFPKVEAPRKELSVPAEPEKSAG